MYTATEFSSIEDKEKFEKHFKRFVKGGFKKTVFPKWFYNRLSTCFGHIAHYSQRGFYYNYFNNPEGKMDFLESIVVYPCYGDPAYTFSDVEKELQKWVKDEVL